MIALFTLINILLITRITSKSLTGTNIGGWQVLEPWITPSLFYRFLGKTHSDGVGIDQYTFCESLGPEEGNNVLRAHWDSWITEEHIADLASKEVEIVRLPIGDWTLRPYGPYVGCTNGSAEQVQWFLDTAAKYNLKVLLDVHCVKGSQNGFDNSGQAHQVEWTDEDHFKHWEVLSAEWMGPWNGNSYDYIDYKNIAFALTTTRLLLEKWGNHPALYAFEPVNEPWANSNMTVLKNFYRQVRSQIQDVNPNITFVFHDAFQFSGDVWNDLFEDTDKVVLDTHFYTAWWGANYDINSYCDGYNGGLSEANNIKYDVWVGEWSLATDVCAMWLGGFNDNNSPYVFECQLVDCPYSYLPEPYNVDFDRTASSLGPYGSNPQTVSYGKCQTDSSYFSNDDVTTLGQCALNAFDNNVQGQFLWTAHNELEPKWSYIEAYNNGWIKRQ